VLLTLTRRERHLVGMRDLEIRTDDTLDEHLGTSVWPTAQRLHRQRGEWRAPTTSSVPLT
jgi:hypothetical protein